MDRRLVRRALLDLEDNLVAEATRLVTKENRGFLCHASAGDLDALTKEVYAHLVEITKIGS